jgi:glycosyltransferase involved in cell wall biosynthesis
VRARRLSDIDGVRIVMIAPPWLPVPPGAYGGTEAVIDNLARGLVAAGNDVLLCTTGESTCPVPRRALYERGQGIVGARPSIEFFHVVHAYDAVTGADIVHDHTVLGPVYAAARLPSVRVVTTNHGLFDAAARARLGSIADRVAVIAISAAQARTAAGLPIAGVIHHGIEIRDFPFRSRAADYFVFLGRMSPTKGAHRAARVARAAGQRLVIAAKMHEPAERRYFDERVRPLLDENVVYLGEVGGREKLELLAAARGLINPITWPEPFGLVMIEALACGTPVLAYPNGAAPEIVRHGETGFLCADEADMARRLAEVDGLDRHACREAVEADFSVERMVNAHLELYEAVLACQRVAA